MIRGDQEGVEAVIQAETEEEVVLPPENVVEVLYHSHQGKEKLLLPTAGRQEALIGILTSLRINHLIHERGREAGI